MWLTCLFMFVCCVCVKRLVWCVRSGWYCTRRGQTPPPMPPSHMHTRRYKYNNLVVPSRALWQCLSLDCGWVWLC